MEQSSFERIFGEYLEEPYHSLFKECELLRIDADRASGEIRIQAKSDRLIEMGHINQCALQLAQKANLKKVGLTMKYLPTLFTAEYLPSIVYELKTLSGVVNGFFEGAEAELSGQELLIRLKNGGREILQQAGVDKLIEKIVRDHFSLSLAVSFLEEGTLDVSQLEPPPVVPPPVEPPPVVPPPEEEPPPLFAVTVTAQSAVFLPSTVVTVIFAVPSATAVTLPFSSTVATDGLSLLQETLLLAASLGRIVAAKVCVSPTVRANSVLSRVIPLTKVT